MPFWQECLSCKNNGLCCTAVPLKVSACLIVQKRAEKYFNGGRATYGYCRESVEVLLIASSCM